MKTLTILYSLASTAALAVSPFSLELSASLIVAIGVVALMAGEYREELRLTGAKA